MLVSADIANQIDKVEMLYSNAMDGLEGILPLLNNLYSHVYAGCICEQYLVHTQ